MSWETEPPSMSREEESFREEYPAEAVWGDLPRYIEEYAEEIATLIKEEKTPSTTLDILKLLEELWTEYYPGELDGAWEEHQENRGYDG